MTDRVEPPPLSYAQNMEDYHLWLAFGGRTHGTYIDIGGGHPIAGSVSFWFYERGWQGLVVEPQETLAKLHRRLRPRDTLVRAAIGRERGEIDFYVVDRLHALSTTVRENAEAASKHGASSRTLRMPALSLADLCRTHGLTEIDFLKIDVEGGERDVIAGADWQRYRPAVVLVEAIAPLSNEPAWHSWEPLLLENGYRFALFDTLNRFYVAEERPDLLKTLPKERAPWGSVRHMYEIGLAPENASHPDHELARRLGAAFWASLPYLSDDVVRLLLQQATPPFDPSLIGTEPFRQALGRIACGYDGGHID
jgi:FkbM family methyltransferase